MRWITWWDTDKPYKCWIGCDWPPPPHRIITPRSGQRRQTTPAIRKGCCQTVRIFYCLVRRRMSWLYESRLLLSSKALTYTMRSYTGRFIIGGFCILSILRLCNHATLPTKSSSRLLIAKNWQCFIVQSLLRHRFITALCVWIWGKRWKLFISEVKSCYLFILMVLHHLHGNVDTLACKESWP